jgi:hypothetical protein
MSKKVKLTPPDPERCQAEQQVGAFQLGGRIGERTRCSNKPVTIATEVVPGDDGQRGSMSLCLRCWGKLIEQKGAYYASFTPILPPDPVAGHA